MGNSAVIENYLNRLLKKYQQWWKFYWLIDQEYEQFDFGVEVQTEEATQEGIPAQRGSEKKTISFSVLDGIDLYARKEPVLLVGQPGSGKSTALMRFLLKAVEQAFQDPQAPIPVLIELRRCTIQSGGILTLIQETLERLGLEGVDIKKLQFGNRPFLLLLDGLNELPSRQALTELNNFRENCADLGIPIVVTTRALDADSLGIARKLEIKPLSPPEIQRFFQACLPFESKQRLQELSDRLRELGRTPLMLWMLYVVLKEPQGEIPDSRGELFRRFIQIYERKREEKIYLDEDSKLDGETRRWWTRLLKPLAYEMMRLGKSGEPTDFRLDISKQDAETICKDFLKAEEVNNYPDLAIRCLDALIKHHLIQLDPEKQEIEFCHQLLQEYYAAEWLLDRLSELSDEQLKYYFLNYLKWTEAIGLMMGFLGKSQAEQVVESALDVDLMLGARLAGEVKQNLQPQTVSLLNLDVFEDGREVPKWLKVELLGESKSAAATPFLFQILNNPYADEIAIENIPRAFEKIGGHAGTSALKQFLRHQQWDIVYLAIKALKDIGSEEVIPILGEAIHHDDLTVKCEAVDALSAIGLEAVIPFLREALSDPYENVSGRAERALRKIESKLATPDQTITLQNEQMGRLDDRLVTFEKREDIDFSETKLLELLKNLESEESSIYWEARKDLQKAGKVAIPFLLQSLQHKNSNVRRSVAEILGDANSREVIAKLSDALHSELDPNVRRSLAFALGKLGSEVAVPELIQALSYSPSEWWYARDAARLLGSLKSHAAIPALVTTLQQFPDHSVDRGQRINARDVRMFVALALGKIGSETAVTALHASLNNDKDQAVRCHAAIALSQIASEASILALVQAWKDKKMHAFDLAQIMKEIENEAVLVALPHLVEMLPTQQTPYILGTIVSIQKLCKIYNYNIAQPPPPPPVRKDLGNKNQGQTFNIESVGNLNTGNVTFHGNQIGDTLNG